MARSVMTDAVPEAVVATGRLGGESPLPARRGERLADGKGVHREVESEGSCRQNTGLTNRNRIRGNCVE